MLVGAALGVLALLPYLGALDYPLVQDDRTYLDNPWLRDRAGLVTAFTHDYWWGTRHAGSDLYRPLTVVSLAWNLRWAGSRVGLRAVNVGLHAAVTVLVYIVLSRVFARLGARVGPAAAAAMFAVHPLASEAVLLAVGRAELLAALLGLSAFALLLGAERAPGGSGPRLAASTLLYGLALTAKESAASWLAILAVWWAVSRTSGAGARVARAAALGWLGAFLVFLGLRGLAVGWLPHRPPWVDNPLVLVGPATRVANAVMLQPAYLAKMLYPHPLSVDYGFDQVGTWPLVPWGLLGGASVLVAWAAVAVVLWRVSSATLFCWAFIPAAFVVTGNVVFPIGTVFSERLAYLPLVGFCGLVALLIERAGRRLPVLGVVVLVLVVTGAAGRTACRAREFRDYETFVEATARASPRAVKALANLGRTRLGLGRPAQAIPPLERAVAIWPDYPRALALLAEAHEALGDEARAAEYRKRARGAASVE